MSNCSQNCWIDWNSAVMCFQWLFHIHVCMGMNICLICEALVLATIHVLCVWEIWSGFNNREYKTNKQQNLKKMHHRCWSRPLTRNWNLWGALINYSENSDNGSKSTWNRLQSSYFPTITQAIIIITMHIHPPTTTRVKISQNVDIHVCTSQGLSRALKSQTLSNLTCSKYIYR